MLSVRFPLERREGEGQLPGEGQAEEWEEQTWREPLLRKKEASGRDWVAGEEETVGGEWWKRNAVYERERQINTVRSQSKTEFFWLCWLWLFPPGTRSTRPPVRSLRVWRRSETMPKSSSLPWSRPRHPCWRRSSWLTTSWSPLRHK